MPGLPKYNADKSLLLRTDFSDDNAWEALCEAVSVPSHHGFSPNFDFVSDQVYSVLDIDRMVEIGLDDPEHYYLFVADSGCLTNSELPILVVDLDAEPGRSFRVLPSVAWEVENNLSIANMDFAEFADETDAKGIFRGFVN